MGQRDSRKEKKQTNNNNKKPSRDCDHPRNLPHQAPDWALPRPGLSLPHRAKDSSTACGRPRASADAWLPARARVLTGRHAANRN